MVVYTISLGQDDTFSVKDYGVYDMWTKTGNHHRQNAARLKQQIEGKTIMFMADCGEGVKT